MHYRTTMMHLRLMRKKDFKWDQEDEESFQELKQAVIDSQELYFMKPVTDKNPLILRTDASKEGLGACLFQMDDDGQDRLIIALSSTFSQVERRWSVIEQETYAIVYAVRKLRHYLLGNVFIIETDHRNILWLHKLAMSEGRTSTKLTR